MNVKDVAEEEDQGEEMKEEGVTEEESQGEEAKQKDAAEEEDQGVLKEEIKEEDFQQDRRRRPGRSRSRFNKWRRTVQCHTPNSSDTDGQKQSRIM